MSEPRADYDSPWKEVLEGYFAMFMGRVHGLLLSAGPR
jgi:hypothetical protein